MVRRETRRRTPDPLDQQTRRTPDPLGQHAVCSPDPIPDRKQRKKHKYRSSSQQGKTPHVSSQGSSESSCGPDILTESRTRLKLHKHSGSRHAAAPPRRHPSSSGSDPLQGPSVETETRRLSRQAEEDSGTDLSDHEKGPPSPSSRVPPQLHLRPDVMENQDLSSCSHRTRGQNRTEFLFPDFLPPPFNSWSLSQLAVFYNTEGHGSLRLRPVGSLERYLERLLQLEWHQVQTVQEETGTSLLSNCHRQASAASSRLSSPKCILQCQRGFPLSFLSCLAAGHSAAGHRPPLSGCACAPCLSRPASCSTPCCRFAHARHSRLSPMLGGSSAMVSLPRRSYSESRAPPPDLLRVTSPVRTSSHLRRMQASGNLRNLVHGAPSRAPPTAREHNHCLPTLDSRAPPSAREHNHCLPTLDCRAGGRRWRSGSEQRRTAVDRKPNGSGRRRSNSECRRGGGGGGGVGGRVGGHCRRTAEFKLSEIKPDAVAAIKDNLPVSKLSLVPVPTASRSKHVDFVT